MRALSELLDLVLRWLHVIAAIMWIGNSLLFNWLDRNLRPAARPQPQSRGEIWLLHSGGFYEVEKTLAPEHGLPAPLHWFKWQAYTTWLSGASLLVLVYYLGGAALTVNPQSGLDARLSVWIGVGAILGGWAAYELIWRSPLGKSASVGGLLSFTLLLIVAWMLSRYLSGRAAFLHTGALLGTIMAANVALHIMPAQRAQVAEVERDDPPDARLSARAKTRSIHNNYMTFPVIVLMLGNHFPRFYSVADAWVVTGVLVLAGAAARHVLNIRFGWRRWPLAFAAISVASLGGLYLLTARRSPNTAALRAQSSGTVSFEDVVAIIQKRCTVCHSHAPADRSFGIAPGGVTFDTPDQITTLAPRIQARAIDTETMPPANRTWMTPEERTALGRWLAAEQSPMVR